MNTDRTTDDNRSAEIIFLYIVQSYATSSAIKVELTKMASGYEVVDVGHYGGKEHVRSEWNTIRAVFCNFESLPAERGKKINSPVLTCHGIKWIVEVYPGGNPTSVKEEVFVSIYLRIIQDGGADVKASFTIRVPSNGEGGIRSDDEVRIFSKAGNASWGYPDFAKREDVLNSSKKYLVDGNLTVEVDIQMMLDKPPTWTPTNTVCSDMLKMLESDDPDDFDVAFEVGGDDPQHIFAHRSILKARAPDLADIVANIADSSSNIPIEDVEPDVFRMFLRFIYGGEVPPKDTMDKDARAIIRAANRFGCTGLKLAAEAEMAAAGITTDNAAELIIFADATNCAMLKEAAMDYFVENAQKVMESDGFALVKESPSVMAELMTLGFGKKRPADSADADEGRDYKRMRVATLRKKLDEKGLDVDGSKEMLVSRLEAESL